MLVAVAETGDNPEILASDVTVISLEQWLAASHGASPVAQDSEMRLIPVGVAQDRALRRVEDEGNDAPDPRRERLAMLMRDGTATASPAQVQLAIRLLEEAQACRLMAQRLPVHIQLRLATLRHETGLALDIELL